MINNPLANYNVYLSTTMIPGVLLIFMFLISAYSIGTELKFKESKKWLAMADNNIYVAMAGKMLPQTIIFLTIFYAFEIYIYYVLGFPHPGGLFPILLLGLLTVLAGQGFVALLSTHHPLVKKVLHTFVRFLGDICRC